MVMSDFSLYIDLVATRLQNDDTLNALVNGQVIRGFQRAMADDYLGETNHACVGVRNLNDRSQGLPGCFYHGASEHDQLLEIRIIHKTNGNDAYCGQIADRIEELLKPGFTQRMNDVDYQVPYVGNISFSPFPDDSLTDRIEVQGTVRIKYYG